MTPTYSARQDLKVWPTNSGPQKIDSSMLKTFKMVLASFQVKNELGKTRFFQEIILVVYTSMEVIWSILFLALSNVNMLFAKRKLTWKLYISAKALLTIKQVKIIDNNKFAKIMFDENSKTFVIYIVALETFSKLVEIMIHLLWAAQITNNNLVQIAFL